MKKFERFLMSMLVITSIVFLGNCSLLSGGDIAIDTTGSGGIVAVCGNGAIESVEGCDDGNTVSGDGCSASCGLEVANAICGNGVTENSEACDDGNTTSGDGCSSNCTIDTVPVSGPVAEGSSGSAKGIALASLPYSGTVDTFNSYYAVSGLTAGNNYTINLTGISDDVDLYFYDVNSSFSGIACSSTTGSTTASESCSFTVTGSTGYILVSGAFTTAGASFTLNMTDNGAPVSGPAAEGTSGSAKGIAFASLPYSGTVDTTSSYYA